MKALDLRNKKFNLLTCIEPSKERKGPSIVWKCLCDCGEICYKAADTIIDGRSKYCNQSRHQKSKYGTGFWTKFTNYQDSAKKRNKIFLLTEDEAFLLMSSNCYYCNTIPKQRCRDFIYNGIDRVNNSLDYTIDNCVPCCKICNRAKDIMSKEEFLIWIEKIYNHQHQGQQKL